MRACAFARARAPVPMRQVPGPLLSLLPFYRSLCFFCSALALVMSGCARPRVTSVRGRHTVCCVHASSLSIFSLLFALPLCRSPTLCVPTKYARPSSSRATHGPESGHEAVLFHHTPTDHHHRQPFPLPGCQSCKGFVAPFLSVCVGWLRCLGGGGTVKTIGRPDLGFACCCWRRAVHLEDDRRGADDV